MEINYSNLTKSEINYIKNQKKLNSKFNIRCKNAINENNCFINVCFHSIIHFDKFIDFILNENENFPINSNTPKLIIEIKDLISSYKKLGNDKTNNNLIITPLEFRKALASYYEKKGLFQLHSEGDPVELLNNILNFIHAYIASNYNNIDSSEIKCNPNCIVHKLFYITEKNNCTDCDFKNELKYDFNNFMYLINVESIFEIVQKNNLNYEKVINKFFELTLKSISKSTCPKCNNHFRIAPKERLNELLDSYDIIFNDIEEKHLDFPDYEEKLNEAKKATQTDESIVCALLFPANHRLGGAVF